MKIKDAIDIILRNSSAISSEMVTMDNAIGRVLAEDIFAAHDDPPFTRSAMDGWAIPSLDSNSFKKGNVVKAGDKDIPPLSGDTAIKVMTGAPLPDGTRAVVKIEDVKEEADKIIFNINPSLNANIRERGEYLRSGEKIAVRGDVITPVLCSILYSDETGRISVKKKPRTAVLATGSELVPFGVRPDYGQIVNSNGPLLASLCRKWGCDVDDLGICPDELNTLKKCLSAIGEFDIFLVCGGASVGDFDFVPQVLKELGAEIFFSRLSVKPGKHLLFARLNKSLIFALPGNPVSTLTSAYIFVQSSIRRMLGLTPDFSVEKAVYKGEIPDTKDRDLLEPAYLIPTSEGHSINYIPNGGSADLFSWSKADAIILLYCNDLQNGEKFIDFVRL